ncbi:SDR family oxidoreductase [Methanoregula sp.]|uniref:SDR family oxidoreductase n=2 Tax=Methanoregula sp. TaxID=2052170 RepID=UPI003C3EBE6F
MRLDGNTVLITGGATGIGLALAKAFIQGGSEVIVCARTENHLKEAKKILPSLHTRKANVANETERQVLYEWAVAKFPKINVLVNNAGIQRMIDFRKGTEDLFKYRVEDGEDEIEINLRALVYMTALFTPHLSHQKEAAIINVSSGLAFMPMAPLPVYCATKAAVHSFSITLRQQLEGTSVRVFEMIPPMVDTNLDKGARKARGQTHFGMSPADFIVPAMRSFANDEYEIRVRDPNLPAQWGDHPAKNRTP